MLLLIWSAWDISYVAYRWISFFVIGFKKLPRCEFTALSHWLLKKNNHTCVDSVLNSRLGKMQQQNGISSELLETESNLPGPIQYVGSIICYQSLFNNLKNFRRRKILNSKAEFSNENIY